jgi:sugar-specific transcriptional regulator TrmB
VSIKETVVRDRMVSRLKELELSTHEALTYLTLLARSNVTASTLCKETSIPDSKIYFVLDGLSKKGMITVQKGNPNVYRSVPPKEALANLKQQMTERLNEKIKETDALADQLTPMYESAEKPEELELAYTIYGRKNIVNRMKALIEGAQQEVTLFVSYPTVLEELKQPMLEAREKNRLKLNIAVTQEVLGEGGCSSLDVRLLRCSIDPIGMLISDNKRLLTLANWSDEVATLTQDQNLIRVVRDYYDNPACCARLPLQKDKMPIEGTACTGRARTRRPSCVSGSRNS